MKKLLCILLILLFLPGMGLCEAQPAWEYAIDPLTLRNLGAAPTSVKRIFIIEGNLISLLGAIIGTILGVVLCGVQQHYGVISMGQSEGAFIVEAYPVVVHAWDLVVILLTVVAVSALVVWYPVKRLL